MPHNYISNDSNDLELLNLKINAGGKGPYLIRQEGIDGKSMDLKTGRYLLRKDGTWTLGLKAASLPDEKKKEFFFDDFDEVYAFLQTLTGKPKVDSALPEGKTAEEIQATAEETVNRIWKAVQEAKGSRISMGG